MKKIPLFHGRIRLYLGATILGCALGLSIGFVRAAWSEPAGPPPTANIAAPLNIGAISQYKEGGLILGGGSPPVGLLISGPTKFGVVVSGTVAIGVSDAFIAGIKTMTPLTEKLLVNGQIKITGGNPAVGSILVSDENGLASWQPSRNEQGGVVKHMNVYELFNGVLQDGSTIRATYNDGDGVYTWTAPPETTHARVRVWGGGGGGNGAYSGGGGGYAESIVSITPQTQYTVIVGTGGSGRRGANAGNAGYIASQNGHLSSFSLLGTKIVWALGGGKASDEGPGDGGRGFGTLSIDGGFGEKNDRDRAQGGNSPQGGNGGGYNHRDGFVPGGGGAGGLNGGALVDLGANGQQAAGGGLWGMVVIEW